MSENELSIRLEPELYDAIAELVANTGAFDDVDDYVNCVLRGLFRPEEARAEEEAEERRLRERLRELGYLE